MVSRQEDAPIFTDLPRPLTLMMPLWVRPYTVLTTLHALDATQHGADVRYVLQAGQSFKSI